MAKSEDNAGLVCVNCGAIGLPKNRARFLKRHPKLCKERADFAKQLAAGTRSVPDSDLEDAGESISPTVRMPVFVVEQKIPTVIDPETGGIVYLFDKTKSYSFKKVNG